VLDYIDESAWDGPAIECTESTKESTGSSQPGFADAGQCRFLPVYTIPVRAWDQFLIAAGECAVVEPHAWQPNVPGVPMYVRAAFRLSR
jgi:hypothetical protein